MNDTIAAISTAFGEAAVAMIRVSGEQALEVAERLWLARKKIAHLPARFAARGAMMDGGEKLDEVLLTVFRSPASYTGEDTVEVSCHGGVLIARRILEAILRNGARAAEPGEFTQRAYLNGKLDLTQAEAVMDLISAQSDLALRAASEQLAGKLGEQIHLLRSTVLGILANVEALIDFPDEDISPDSGAALCARMDAAMDEINALLATAARGKVLREGVKTVIGGAPNVGKSSLLNLLLGFERAIVSTRPGTTRDVLEETIVLAGIPIRIADTAGMRATEDELELAGIQRARSAINCADLILHVVDSSLPKCDDSKNLAAGEREILVLNKCDLPEHPSWNGAEGVRISCVNGMGTEALAAAIQKAVLGGAARTDWSVAVNARHAVCLERAKGHLHTARHGMDEKMPIDLLAEELRMAMGAIGEIVGHADSDEVLGVIFSSFCIGK